MFLKDVISANFMVEDEYKRILKSRASYEWITRAGYGLMFHWTSQSVNPKPSLSCPADNGTILGTGKT
jgi:hypothetical protein